MVFFHDWTADAASRAGRHLDEAVVDLAALDVLKRLDAVFDAVDCHVCIARCTVHECFQNSAGRREEARETLRGLVDTWLELDVLLLKPFGQLLECQNRVDHAAGEVGFVLLRYARSDEHGLCLGTSTLDIGAVSVHRRHNVGKIAEYIREIFLDKQVYRMTAGRNYNVAMFVCEQLFVFGLDNRSSDRGLLDIIETELLYSLAHRFDADAVVIGNERRSEADVYRRARLQQYPRPLCFVDDFFRILRAHDKALTAHYTFIADYMSLIRRKAYRLYRAMPDTFVAVLAVGFFQSEIIRHLHDSFHNNSHDRCRNHRLYLLSPTGWFLTIVNCYVPLYAAIAILLHTAYLAA